MQGDPVRGFMERSRPSPRPVGRNSANTLFCKCGTGGVCDSTPVTAGSGNLPRRSAGQADINAVSNRKSVNALYIKSANTEPKAKQQLSAARFSFECDQVYVSR